MNSEIREIKQKLIEIHDSIEADFKGDSEKIRPQRDIKEEDELEEETEGEDIE